MKAHIRQFWDDHASVLSTLVVMILYYQTVMIKHSPSLFVADIVCIATIAFIHKGVAVNFDAEEGKKDILIKSKEDNKL